MEHIIFIESVLTAMEAHLYNMMVMGYFQLMILFAIVVLLFHQRK